MVLVLIGLAGVAGGARVSHLLTPATSLAESSALWLEVRHSPPVRHQGSAFLQDLEQRG